jgi:hypothetical protein
VVLSLYVLCGMVAFWVMFTAAATVPEADPPGPSAAAAVSLAASAFWPLLLLGAIQMWVVASISDRAPSRGA